MQNTRVFQPQSCKELFSRFKLPLLILLSIFLLRTVSLGTVDLIDTSDARYAQIANDMARSNNYVTPMIEQGKGLEPYWSKPPLAFWLMASSIEVFGTSEWAARLPTGVTVLLTSLLCLYFGITVLSPTKGIVAALAYFSTGSIFFLAGSTMIDPMLTFCITGFMVCFGVAILGPEKSYIDLWGFFFAALGVLVKGPIAFVFPGLSLVLYTLWVRDFSYFKRIHWFTGIILFSAVALPWFYFAEQRTPGFLRYFIIEENVHRLFSKNLKLTSGIGHRTPFGLVWLLFPLMTLPWVLGGIVPAWKSVRKTLAEKSNGSRETVFMLTWMLAPLLMLTIGKQVLATYALPAIPAFCLLFASLVTTNENVMLPEKFLKCWRSISLGVLVLCVFISPVYRVMTHESAVSTNLFICLILLGSGICAYKIPAADSLQRFALTALLMVLACTSLNFGAEQPADDYKSTRTLIEHIGKTIPSSNRTETLQFLERVPQSALFYASRSDAFKAVMVRSKNIPSLTSGILVMRDKDLKDYPELQTKWHWEKFAKWRFTKR